MDKSNLQCFLCGNPAVARMRVKGQWRYVCQECIVLLAPPLLNQGEACLFCVRGEPVALAIPTKETCH